MYLEKASAKIHNHELYIIQLQEYKRTLQDFVFSEKLSKKDGNKILAEIELINEKIKKKSKAFSDSLRLEYKEIK